MNNRQQFEFYTAKGIMKQTPEERIAALVDKLISALYIPEMEFDGLTKVDPLRIEHFGLDDKEPINWGDLKCVEVEKVAGNDAWYVTIDEAAPDDCPELCAYIAAYMKSWGWPVIVKTEW